MPVGEDKLPISVIECEGFKEPRATVGTFFHRIICCGGADNIDFYATYIMFN